MTSESVSFRISRHTQDLAQTTHALSRRLVKLEQRLEALELEVLTMQDDRSAQQEPEPLDSLESVERLLNDCRALLGLDDAASDQQTASGEFTTTADVAEVSLGSAVGSQEGSEPCAA